MLSAAGVTMRTCVPRRQAPTSSPAYMNEFHRESGTLITAPFPMSEYNSALPTFNGLGRYPVPLLSWSARGEDMRRVRDLRHRNFCDPRLEPEAEWRREVALHDALT